MLNLQMRATRGGTVLVSGLLRKLQQVQGGMESVVWVSIHFRSDPEIHVPNLPQGNTLLSVGIS